MCVRFFFKKIPCESIIVVRARGANVIEEVKITVVRRGENNSAPFPNVIEEVKSCVLPRRAPLLFRFLVALRSFSVFFHHEPKGSIN